MDTGSSETHLPSSASSHPIDAGGFAPGTLLAGRYRIVAQVGRGGMGEVYRADDLKLGQTVALKFLPAGLEQDAAARERLLAEVRSARTVSHPNVCRVYDVGEIEGSGLKAQGSGAEEQGAGRRRLFLTMEYIDGEDLASLLRRIGRLPAGKALEVARQLCAGLAAAHDKGLLHRDLKPANVMIDGRGQARITDFGLAVPATVENAPADAAGTLAYMAPERFEGKPATVQSDLYALGLILYETYTGKPAFKADSFREWQRAHSDSTPTSPAALASDVEPAVERAILRCLEKDPARRPKSAGQVAAALPGGDPLAAAIAAGETPSPELVAASGEEGTLPRAKAWVRFVACLLALAIAPFCQFPFSLTDHVPIDLSPDALKARARDTLRELGYTESPAGSAWWFRLESATVDRLDRMKPGEAAAELRTGMPGPLLFCYRQSPAGLNPVAPTGTVTATDPPPQPGDAYVELDPRGRLVTLAVKPPAFGEPHPSGGVSWPELFAAAHLGSPEQFSETGPRWWPDAGADSREAREGNYAGQAVRVEAAVRAGRPIFFRLLLPWIARPGSDAPAGRREQAGSALQVMIWGGVWLGMFVLAFLARRNVRLGRANRAGAMRLAVVIGVASAAPFVALGNILTLVRFGSVLGGAMVSGLFCWLFYLGFEPAVRRTTPRLVVTLTRLLDGRWRDPLVGRGVLAGAMVGFYYSVPLSLLCFRLMDLPGSGPTNNLDLLGLGNGFAFIGTNIFGMLSGAWLQTAYGLTLLLIVRLAVGRERLSWAVFAVILAVLNSLDVIAVRPLTISPWFLVGAASVYSLMVVWLLRTHGVLAYAVSNVANVLITYAPWTTDLSRWYAWRQFVVLAVVGAIVFWGFRNVLGKQSAFPAGALDG